MKNKPSVGAIMIDASHKKTEAITSAEALHFITELQAELGTKRLDVLAKRNSFQRMIDEGDFSLLRFSEVAGAEGDWIVAPADANIGRRRVEIISAPSRKMIINGLNSGADIYIADFDDSLSPTWDNVLHGHLNVRDAVNKSIEYIDYTGKKYAVAERRSLLFMRPRGMHLEEKHLLANEQPVAASFFDVGMFVYHCARKLAEAGQPICLYIPKIESHFEANLWNDLLSFCEARMGLEPNRIKAALIIESVPAALAIEPILFALKDRSAGISYGRWDYIFSHVRTFQKHPQFLLPERSKIDYGFTLLRSLASLVIAAASRHKATAIGSMSSYIPERNVNSETERHKSFLMEKMAEVAEGFDGTWVAHPNLVAECKKLFDATVTSSKSGPVNEQPMFPCERCLLVPPKSAISFDGLRQNVRVAVNYFQEWLLGHGAIRLDDRMEDTATAEITRCQVWQWLHNNVATVENGPVTFEQVRMLLESEGSKCHARQCIAAHSMAENLLIQAWQSEQNEPNFTKMLYDKIF